MIYEIFQKSKENQELIGVALYGEQGFWCGIVEDFNAEFIQLRHYTKYGELDGVAIEKIVNIERVDIDDTYLKSLKILIENKEKIKNVKLKSRVFEDLNSENWQFVMLKPYENDKNVIVSVQINNDNFYRGFVLKIDEYFLKFEIIGSEGESNGVCLFKMEDINSIKTNDLECRKRLLLYNAK